MFFFFFQIVDSQVELMNIYVASQMLEKQPEADKSSYFKPFKTSFFLLTPSYTLIPIVNPISLPLCKIKTKKKSNIASGDTSLPT